jgi:glycosyltransferase involved in cell wall biosynthesis
MPERQPAGVVIARRDDELETPSRVATGSAPIAFLIDRLNYGGAARQLVVLSGALRRRGHRVVVMVFYSNGPLEPELRASGVDVRVLNKRGRWDLLRFGLQLCRVIRQERPHVLHGYLGVPNICAVALKPLFPSLKVVWAVRSSNMQLETYGWLPRVLDRIEAALSRYADLIIANSVAGFEHVMTRGYPAERLRIIPNGIDTDRFAPSSEARWRIRAEWGLKPNENVIGVVGRLDPLKGHHTFLEAAAILGRERREVRFVCIGDGPASYRAELQRRAAELGVDRRLLWVPNQADMAAVYNGLDVLCSPSYSEGFPNVIGEAMACGVRCVVTDVGDSADLLGVPNLTVRPRDPRALAMRLDFVLDSPAKDVARATEEARQRILRRFSIANLAQATEAAIAPWLEQVGR